GGDEGQVLAGGGVPAADHGPLHRQRHREGRRHRHGAVDAVEPGVPRAVVEAGEGAAGEHLHGGGAVGREDGAEEDEVVDPGAVARDLGGDPGVVDLGGERAAPGGLGAEARVAEGVDRQGGGGAVDVQLVDVGGARG